MRSFLLGVSALVAVPAIAYAQSAATNRPLETVVISGTRIEETLPQELAKYGTRVETISSSAVQNGGYIDAAGALNALAPGLYVQAKNGPFDYVDISFQGSRTSDVLWLVDGVRINNRLYAGTTPLDTVPSSIIERIELVEGGQALFYGTQATAGAVNIITKDFTDHQAGSVSLGADTNRGGHIDGNISDSFGASQFVLFGSKDKATGFQPFRDKDYQPSGTDRHRSYDVLSLGGKYAYSLSDSARFSASVLHTGADLDFAQPYRVERQVNSRKETLVTAKFDDDVSDKFGFYVKTYYHWWDTHYDTLANSLVTPGAVDVIYKNAFWGFTDYGLNAVTKFTPGGGFDYFAGYDVQRYGGSDDVLFIAKNKETTQAVFGQIRTNSDLIADGNFAAGFRYNMPSDGDNALVWNVSGLYNLNDNLFVRGQFGTAFRLPTAEELFADDPADERGNPNLKPEKSTNANASIGGTFGDVSNVKLGWEAIGFWREISNLIDLDTFDAVTGQDVFGNLSSKVKTRGAELALKAEFSAALSADAAYTFNSTKASGSSLQLRRVPESQLKAGLDWHPAGSPFGATISLNHVGDTYENVSSIGRMQYGDYNVLDVGVRMFLGADRQHRFDLTLQNALDEQYGRPSRACADVAGASFFSCSAPYAAVNLGLGRTAAIRYTYSFN